MTTTETNPAKRPDYTVYHIRNLGDGQCFWTRIGSAWTHGDSKGLNIMVDVVPIDGRITLRTVSEPQE